MSTTSLDHGPLPLSSLRLLVPPLRLMSAAVWQLLKQGAVRYYGPLEEFISSVLETVPELLSHTERVQLVMGLRAKVVLECFHTEDFTNPHTIQLHLNKINTYLTKQESETDNNEIRTSVTNFLDLVQTIMDDQSQRDIFYQKIFPTVYGPKYDSALEALMRKFLLNLQKLLPVPDLEQTCLWLSLHSTFLKECVDFMKQPEPLNTLIQHHRHHGPGVPQAFPFSNDDCILSSLSFCLPKINKDEKDDVAITVCVGEDVHSHETVGSVSRKEGFENYVGIKSEMEGNLERNQPHCADESTDYQGASVEVTLDPFDQSELTDDDVSEDGDDADVDKMWSPPVKIHNRTSTKGFKSGKGSKSVSKLKRHKVTNLANWHRFNNCIRNESAAQSAFITTNNLHPNPEISAEKSETELPPAGVSTLGSANLFSFVCQPCGRTYMYQKTLNRHQRNCVFFRLQQQMQKTPQGRPISDNLADGTNVATLGEESDTEPLDVALHQSTSPDPGETSSHAKKTFSCSDDLKRHMSCHINQSLFCCARCGQDFTSYEACRIHEDVQCSVSKGEPESMTKFTEENFLTKPDKKHLKKRNADAQKAPDGKSSMKCQECGRGFTYSRNFEKHRLLCPKKRPLLKKPTFRRRYIIDGCKFQTENDANENGAETSSQMGKMSTGDQDRSIPIKCTMCQKSFSEISHLKKHYAKRHELTGPYPCQLCRTTFVRLCELIRHQQNKKLYRCSTCKKSYTQPKLLEIHRKLHVPDETAHICEICGQACRTLGYLCLHLSTHGVRQPYVCSYCAKRFSTKEYLRAHMVRHTGAYPCPVCGRKFNRKSSVQWHLHKHAGRQPHVCQTCGKMLPTGAQLRVHMIKHSEERPFKCEDCDVSYKRRAHLAAHRKEKHMKLRPFVCQICNKGFRLNNFLKSHMMVHTGERPFVCQTCGKSFTRSTRLREHRKKTCR